MRTIERVQELKKLNPIEISSNYKMQRGEAKKLANALRDYIVLSDNSKSKHEMAEELGYTDRTVDEKRSILIKNKLIKPWKTGKKLKIEDLKKLSIQRSKPNIIYRISYFSEELMKEANLDPQGKYYYKTEVRDKSVLVTFLTPEEAKKYREKSQS